MPKSYPNFPNPTMIYDTKNRYTVIDAADLQAFLAAGWSASPTGDIYTPPAEFADEVTVPQPLPEPSPEPVAEPVADPIPESVPEPVEETVVEPVAEPRETKTLKLKQGK